MAQGPVNGDANAIVDEVGKAPEGVVLPPRDIRAIVERTAGYVARNGPVFEERIRDKETHNAKFSFLSPNDAYNPFYSWRLSEVRAGRGNAVSAGRVGETAAPAEPEKPKGPEPPPDLLFSARMPNISAQDLEVVRLTALFVAKNGRAFMTSLSQKEARNFQFDFLRPQHSLYQFFSRLVDQYTDLLQAPSVDGGKRQQQRLRELEANVKDRFHVLAQAKRRAEWVKYQQQQKQQKEEDEEKEKLEYAQIDWHDFVVVESVLFSEADDHAELPPPTSLNDLQSASLEQKAAMSLQPAGMRIEEAMPTDGTAFYNHGYNQYQQPQQHQQAYGTMPAMAGPTYPAGAYPPSGHAEEQNGMTQGEQPDHNATQAAQSAARTAAGQPMRIRNDYVPRAQAKRQTPAMGICPNCRQQIALSELDEHMRIELLDPRWKEQKMKAESRTYNPSPIDISANLKRLASQRDVGAAAGQPSEEEARRKRAAMGGEGMDINEQIRSIQERYKT